MGKVEEDREQLGFIHNWNESKKTRKNRKNRKKTTIRQFFCEHTLKKQYDHKKDKYVFLCVKCNRQFEKS